MKIMTIKEKKRIFHFLLLSCIGVGVFGTKHKKKLFQHLFVGYDARFRPVLAEEIPVNVTLQLNLYQLVEINEKEENIKISGWFNQRWKDAHLTWKPEDFGGISKIHIQPSLIWKPDIVLYNNADDNIAKYGGTVDRLKTRIIVDHQGNLGWFAPVLLKAQCSIHVNHFPFDTQHCFFKFGSATYDVKEVNVFGEDINLRNFSPHQEWSLITHHTLREAIEYPCCPETLFPDVKFHFQFQRRSLFYIVNLIFPIFSITLLTVWIFVLPAQCGDRMSVGVTLFLALTVFMMIVAGMVPESSESLPLAHLFIIFCAIIMFLIIISIAFVDGFYSRNGQGKTIGRWTRLLVLDKLAYIVRVRLACHSDTDCHLPDGTINFGSSCMTSEKHSSNSMNNTTDSGLAQPSQNVILRSMSQIEQNVLRYKDGTEDNGVEQGNKRLNISMKKDDKRSQNGKEANHNYAHDEEWHIVGKTLDRCFFLVFMLAFLIGCLCCFRNAKYCY